MREGERERGRKRERRKKGESERKREKARERKRDRGREGSVPGQVWFPLDKRPRGWVCLYRQNVP